ncbi:MAG: CDP-diacylglycerol--glycerol-3-phosphate 3-phosphatidyltransferase [Puniceicoccales bacterium]|nr:CDP-diacylglycerol--glycerol-3-phosphate 3-phosphatidyltransferase [Puniceicoccales bacterium]
MNLPNWITLIRIPLLFVIGGFFYASFPGSITLAFIVYVLAGITDWLDGYLARKYNQTSELGKLLDALNDKIFTVGIFILLIGKHLVPLWGVFCVLLIVCREFLVTGLRIVAAKSGNILAAEKLGKIKTVLQIVVMGSFLLIEMLKIDGACWFPASWLVGLTYLNYVNLVITTGLTAYSGSSYLIKYRYLCSL